MSTSKDRDKLHPEAHLAINAPAIVSQQEWEAARQRMLVKEKAFTRARDASRGRRVRSPPTPSTLFRVPPETGPESQKTS